MNRKYKGSYGEGEDMLWKIAAKAFMELSNAGVHALYALEQGTYLAGICIFFIVQCLDCIMQSQIYH